ncbi:hypothetical protein GGU11DRAFT_745082 [Lentinula aff. detonsa]|nr:hypothetical protein GGU11DRAFT_745082 [Lentinula aff. detonsa]
MLSSLYISTFLAVYIGRSLCQSTSVTLWEFGAPRLDGGQTTLPLRPIGTPSDGLSTTYLYEVVNLNTMFITEDGSPVVTIAAIPATRTIVASASGWIENFGTTDQIQCNFFASQSASGICSDRTRTDVGTPTPQVLAVDSTSSVAAFTTTLSTQIPSPVNSPIVSSPTTAPKKVAVGSIVGGAVGGALAGCMVVVLMFWLLRRWQRRSSSVSEIEKANGLLDNAALTVRPSFSEAFSANSQTNSMITPSDTILTVQTQKARKGLRPLQRVPMNVDSSDEGVTALEPQARMIGEMGVLADEPPPPTYSDSFPNHRTI